VVSVASHWAGPVFADMVACHEKGDVAGAIEANQRLLPSFDFESSDDAPNPVPTKAMMRLLGQRVGHCRPPMGPEPADLADRARVVAGALGLEV
jgi:4-hydroxy-tetrahydrodipicolinate synthase